MRLRSPAVPLVSASAVLLAIVSLTAQGPASANVPRPSTAAHASALFAHSDNCVACHNQLTTSSGEDVSIGTAWRATMMANSARDPYFLASVRRETVDHPRRAA